MAALLFTLFSLAAMGKLRPLGIKGALMSVANQVRLSPFNVNYVWNEPPI